MAKEEPLTQKEFQEFKDNHFDHLCIDVAGIKKDINWLKWLVCGTIMAVIVRLVLLFFSI